MVLRWLAAGLAALAVFAPAEARADTEGWLWYEHRIHVSGEASETPRVSLRLMNDLRFNRRSDGLDMMFFRAGPVVHLAPWFFAAAHATIVSDKLPNGAFSRQFRPELDLNPHGRLGPFTWIDRNRIEGILTEATSIARYRNMLRVNYAPPGTRWIPFAFEEILVRSDAQRLHENRVALGLGFVIHEGMRIEAAYMLRSRKVPASREHDHIGLLSFFVGPAAVKLPPRSDADGAREGRLLMEKELMEQINKLLENPVIHGAAVALVYVVVISLIVRLAKRVVQGRVQDKDLRYRISKSISFAGYLAVLLVFLSGVAGKFSGLSVALGAASAGVAFALQEVIASFAGWLAIAFGNFFKVGDRVKLGGIHGDVIDIGFLRTTIMECGGWVNGDLHNGRVVRVANSFVFKEPVYNYSGEFPFLWDEITVPIKYGSSYDEASQMLEKIAREITRETADSARARWTEFVKAYRIEDSSVDPLVTMIANDNWVEFTVRYVVDFRRRRTTKDALFRKILAAVEGSDGRIGMASMTVHLVETPTIDVRLSRRALPQVS